jgi:cysteine synthase A
MRSNAIAAPPIHRSVADIVNDDIFVELPGFLPGIEVIVKLEGLNPGGSIKMKTARALLADLEDTGQLHRGGHVIESSSGNLGVALSVACAARGYALTIVTDPNANAAAVKAMRALGTDVVVVAERDANGGFLGTRINYIRERLERDHELVWTNQYASPANATAHYWTTAASVHRAVPGADVLAIGAGTTGTLMGCMRYFAEHHPTTRLVAVDSVGSVLFGGPAGRRWLPGLGASRVPESYEDNGTFVKTVVPETEAVAVCRRLARRYGLLAGGSTGTVLAAVIRLAGDIETGSTVVALSPDMGDRYLDTLYDDEWTRHRFGQSGVDTLREHR